MSMMQILFPALIFVVVMAMAAGLLLLLKPNEAQLRLRQLVAGERSETGRDGGWLKFVANLTRPISELASPEEGFEQSSVKLRFVHAGIRNPAAPTAFYGLKTAFTLPLPSFAALAFTDALPNGNKLLLVLAALGYYGPNLVLNSTVKRRQREILERFPDALDLMTVCVEAGLGTEAAMMRVAKDLQVKSPALGDELCLVNLELRAGGDRERALRNLAFRTGVDEIDRFVTMINQADRFGTAQALDAYRKAAKAAPDDADVHNAIGLALARQARSRGGSPHVRRDRGPGRPTSGGASALADRPWASCLLRAPTPRLRVAAAARVKRPSRSGRCHRPAAGCIAR